MTIIKNKECKFCKKEITKETKICPNCKKDVRPFLGKNPFITIIVILFIVTTIIGFFKNETDMPDTGICSYDMKEHIKNQYKSPSTVKFISCRYEKYGDSRKFFGEADAQNSFGATLRSYFICEGALSICKIESY